MTLHLTNNLYNNKIISENKLNIYLEKIININNKICYFSKNKKITFSIFKKYSKNKIKTIIKDLINLVYINCESIGTSKISNIINILLKKNEFNNIDIDNLNYKNIIDYYDKYFISMNSKIIKNDNILLNIDNTLPFVKKIENKNKLYIDIFGAILYIPINNNIIIIEGYFKSDPLNLYYNEEINIDKKLDLDNKINLINIPFYFKDNYINQLSISEFMVNNNDDIINNLKSYYNDLKKYKNKSLSLLIKEFLKSSLKTKRKILILFLISNKDDQIKSQILFELISKDNTFLSKKNYSNSIYSSLHWNLRKLFKIVEKKIF